MTENLFSMLGLKLHDRVAIIGCGGKTSLIYALAAERRGDSVLLTTTTHILRPPAHVYDFDTHADIKTAKKGVHLFVGDEKDGKLTTPSADELARLQRLFDLVLIEADGSKMRPLKGWADYEPVIPDFVTATVAVATVAPIGEAISEENTHRLPIFCDITNAAPNESVAAEHIAAMIAHPRGMIQRAVGKRILFINQVESESSRKYALEIFDSLPKTFLQSLSRVVIGSLRQNEHETIWEANS